MKKLVPLMHREWLQHRLGWLVAALLPLALALLVAAFAQVEFDGGEGLPPGTPKPLLMSFAVTTGASVIVFIILWLTSLFLVSGLARRDHADRSIEFWQSLPVGHAESLAVPLLVHLIVVPVAALLVGLLGGQLIGLVLVGRFAGMGAWLGLPWGDMLPATLALSARLAAGLPLATLWLSPLILLTVLAVALFRRWGLPLVVVGLVLGSVLLERVLGEPVLALALIDLLTQAGRAVVGASGQGMSIGPGGDVMAILRGVPAWALADFGAAVHALASPLLAVAVAVAAACFALLVLWRRRGAGL